MNERRIVERREGERERKYVEKVKKDVRGNLAILWIAAILILLIASANESWGKTLKRGLSGFVAAGATSFLVYRIALNGATARFSALEANQVAEEAMQITERALDVERAKLLVERAKLMDGKVHEKAFDFVLLHSEVERFHAELCQGEDYSVLAKCQKLLELRQRFPSQIDEAMERARTELQ